MGSRPGLTRALFALLAGALFSAPAFAAACAPATLLQYETQVSCTIGALTLKQFSFQAINLLGGGLPADAITDAQIQVTPLVVSGSISFNFAGAFHAAAGEDLQYIITYFYDPPPPIIHGEQIDLIGADPVTLQTGLCEGAAFVGAVCGATLQSLSASTGSPISAILIYGADVNMLGVRNVAELDSRSALVSMFSSFDNTTFLSPEPAAVLLTGAGLLGLLGFRRRLRVR